MDAERISIANTCLDAAYDGSLTFPEIIGKLLAAGYESYMVDYRQNTQTYYLPDGETAMLEMPRSAGTVAAILDVPGVAALVRWAQTNGPDYSYKAFCEKVKAAGCAGYIVSFPGRRVVYFGRTAETHVEHFPN
ncbi:DUF1398 domain-containing protein [Pararhizobium gei]|uniref:DUF1398 domain-containing protein n=1 Tax=Pararhizobium gei TaxID=1395951 RepID=UPI0023DCC410|nr:DUF1398 domain-containing protein [Rhizobium gei]